MIIYMSWIALTIQLISLGIVISKQGEPRTKYTGGDIFIYLVFSILWGYALYSYHCGGF